MLKQAAVAAALIALAGGCEDRTTRTTTNGRVTGSGTDTTYNRTDRTTTTTTTPSAANPSSTTPPSAAAQPDTEFLRKASSINTLEVDASKIALERSQNNDVRSFAEMLGKDHADAKDRLKDVVDKMKVEFPKDLLPEHKAIEDRLKALKGSAFDQEFVRNMIDGHQQAIDVFRQESSSGQNDQLKAYAQSMIPSLQMHLDRAKDLQKKLGTGAGDQDQTSPSGTQPSTPPSTPPSEPSSPGSSPG
jgi:putative membrane protein